MARRSPSLTYSRGRAATKFFLALVVLAGGYLAFEVGRIQADYNIVDARKERHAYEDRIAELEEEIALLKGQIAMLETDREIDSKAYEEVEAGFRSLQAKIQEQANALGFYRGIISPPDGTAGLRVQDLRLARAGDERAYTVKLVLVQSLKHDRTVSGDVGLSVEGVQDGNEVSYPYAQLLGEGAETDWPFEFRYFQEFDREIILPDGFTPRNIRIEVRSKTRSISSVERSFPWTASLG